MCNCRKWGKLIRKLIFHSPKANIQILIFGLYSFSFANRSSQKQESLTHGSKLLVHAGPDLKGAQMPRAPGQGGAGCEDQFVTPFTSKQKSDSQRCKGLDSITRSAFSHIGQNAFDIALITPDTNQFYIKSKHTRS